MVIDGTIDPGLIVAFLLAMVRTAAWLTVTPPFGRTLVPVRVRIGLGVAIGFAMTNGVDTSGMDLSLVPLALAIGYQAFIGVALGFVVLMFFAAFQAAGSIIDFSSGFSVGAVFDPISGNQNATVARVYNLTATTILFAGGGHILIIDGYMRSFRAAPLTGLSMTALTHLLVEGIGGFFVSALQIAFPLAAAMMMTEISLALLARAAPQSNVLMIGLSLKSLVLLLLLASSLAVLPSAVNAIAGNAANLTYLGG